MIPSTERARFPPNFRRRPIPDTVDQLFAQAIDCHRRGDEAQAETLYRQILQQRPQHFGALYGTAFIALSHNDFAAAESAIVRAIAIDAKMGAAHRLHGAALARLGRPREALASFERAVSLDPADGEALFEQGNAMMAVGRIEDAAKSFETAAGLMPQPATAHYNRGYALFVLRRFDQALESYERVLALEPLDIDAHNDRGNMLRELGRIDEALAAHDRAIELQPRFAEAHLNRGIALRLLGRHTDALAAYDAAIAIKPALAEAFHNRGVIFTDIGKLDQAVESFDRAVALKPERADSASLAFDVAAHLCAWADRETRIADLVARARAGQHVEPFVVMGAVDDPEIQALAAINAVGRGGPGLRLPVRPPHARLRVAYVSQDFRDHAVARQAIAVWEATDRARIETYAIALNPSDGSKLRARLEGAFEHFVDAAWRNDHDVTMLMREHAIDIAVDLSGHTRGGRPGIFARRAAPVQAGWLGYPGTIGATFLDYIIADETVIPETNRQYFAEQVVWLPDGAMPFDASRVIAPAPSRAACDLPANGIVFSAYNASYKYTPEMTACWMRILAAVENSVLWLSAGNDTARANLIAVAASSRIDPSRLVFASRVAEPAAHLARLGLANLALDTMPYNGHATSSDLLWAGVPIVTCAGRAFPARVTASLLNAVGLSELGTASLADYEALAIGLGRDPARLAALRQRLIASRATAPLFDAQRFARHLEAAWLGMAERHHAGTPPQAFAVLPIE